jgi:hypothetical protein
MREIWPYRTCFVRGGGGEAYVRLRISPIKAHEHQTKKIRELYVALFSCPIFSIYTPIDIWWDEGNKLCNAGGTYHSMRFVEEQAFLLLWGSET